MMINTYNNDNMNRKIPKNSICFFTLSLFLSPNKYIRVMCDYGVPGTVPSKKYWAWAIFTPNWIEQCALRAYIRIICVCTWCIVHMRCSCCRRVRKATRKTHFPARNLAEQASAHLLFCISNTESNFECFLMMLACFFSLTFYLQSRLHDTIILMYWRCESTRRYECLYINSECVRLRSMRQCAGCVCRGGKACQWPARKKIAEGRAKWKRKKNRIKNDIVDEKEICVRSHDAIHIWMGWKGCIRHNHMKGGGEQPFFDSEDIKWWSSDIQRTTQI